MIMSRNGHYLPKTVHDHENARATHPEGVGGASAAAKTKR
jgi:hypothetical protein